MHIAGTKQQSNSHRCIGLVRFNERRCRLAWIELSRYYLARPGNPGGSGEHFFSFNDSDIMRPAVGLDCTFASRFTIGPGYSRVVYGRSAHIYDDGCIQPGMALEARACRAMTLPPSG